MSTEGRNEVIRFIESVGHGWFGSAQSPGRLEEASPPPPSSELVAEVLDAVLEHLQMILVDAKVVELLRKHDSILAVRRQGNGMAQTILVRQNILRRLIPQVEEDNSMLRSIGDQQPAVGEPGDPRRVDQRADVLLLRLAAMKLGAELVQQVTAGVVEVDCALATVGDCSYLVLLVPGDVRWFLEVTLEFTNESPVRLEEPHGRLSSNLKHTTSHTVQWTGKPVKTLRTTECT